MNNVKAIVFDMDGVLLDAKDWHYRALNEALKIFDAEITYEEHIERFDGLPTRVKLATLASEGRLPIHVHSIVEAVKQERTLRQAAQLAFPKIEHLIMMSLLKRSGYKIGLATNSVRQTTLTMMNFVGLLDYFDVIVTNEDVANAKPAPDLYLKASDELGVLPDQVLVIEDHLIGVTAAMAAGCHVRQVGGLGEVNVDLFVGLLPEFEEARK